MRDGQKRDVARKLRQNSSDAERALWRLLRSRQLAELKFRRQVPIGPYVADFACVSVRLVVELDGGQHAGSRTDERRDDHLRELGWRVLRVWNDEALRNRSGVLEKIAAEADVDLEKL